ncbi:MAG: hypothetical protein RSA20_10350 [Oscillospiraceae bacterium]
MMYEIMNFIGNFFSNTYIFAIITGPVCIFLYDRFFYKFFNKKRKEQEILLGDIPQILQIKISSINDENLRRSFPNGEIYLASIDTNNSLVSGDEGKGKDVVKNTNCEMTMSCVKIDEFIMNKNHVIIKLKNNTNKCINLEKMINDKSEPIGCEFELFYEINPKEEVSFLIQEYIKPQEYQIDFNGTYIGYKENKRKGFYKPYLI